MYICKGNLIVPQNEQQELFDLAYRLQDGYTDVRDEAIERVQELCALHKQSISTRSFAALSNNQEIIQALTWVARLRESDANKPCGYNFADDFADAPQDGQEHLYECPRCGNTGIFVPPMEE